MGLDISSSHIDCEVEYLTEEIERICGEDFGNKVSKLLEESKFEEIKNLFEKEIPIDEENLESELRYQLNSEKSKDDIRENLIQEAKQTLDCQLNKIIKLGGPYSIDADSLEIANSYADLIEDEEIRENRMGSYSTIHYIREFAYQVELLYQNKNISLENVTEQITKEETMQLLQKLLITTTGYETTAEMFFTNLCAHSDCDGYYIPVEGRPLLEDGTANFQIGSSTGLLKELYALSECGAIETLEQLIDEFEKEYPGIKEYHSIAVPKDKKQIYNLANTVHWGWKKLLFHAVESVMYEDIICFC